MRHQRGGGDLVVARVELDVARRQRAPLHVDGDGAAPLHRVARGIGADRAQRGFGEGVAARAMLHRQCGRLQGLRQALGAERINLVGASYGTRAALEYLRVYPRQVRRMVLDGAEKELGAPATASFKDFRERYALIGTKDRKVMIDVLSHRLGHPSDWVLQIFKITRDAAGQEKSERIAEFDDTAAPAGAESLTLGSRDPSGSLVCEENTVYRLQLTDRFQAKKPWRLVLRDPQPGFSVVAFSESPATKGPALHRWSPLLRRGGSSLVQVAVLRRDGFDAPVDRKSVV